MSTRGDGIYALVEEDWPRLRELRLAALLDTPDAFGGTYDEESAREGPAWRWWIAGEEGRSTGRTFVGERDGTLTGMATGMVFADRPTTVHLFGMWVRPADRGRGVGAALVDAVIAWASARDAERMALRVAEGNDGAVRLYERAGFVLRPEDRAPLREGSDVVTIGMELVLAPD